MIKANGNFNDLQGSYLFSEIAKRVEAWRRESGRQDLIFLGIGDVTRPLAPAVIAVSYTHLDVYKRQVCGNIDGYRKFFL